jgi:Cdc6-like AAA superfamily ATPase
LDDWARIEEEVYGLFTPGAPIKVEAELAGRQEQASKLRRIVLSSGEHALVYGERGVGKTSIANSFYGSLNKPTRPVYPVLVNCGSSNFTECWRKVFRRLSVGDTSLANHYTGEITPDDVEIELSSFGAQTAPIIVFDEFDQVVDEPTRRKFTETIKSLSDHVINATIILVGIADNAGQLISDHQSISRALKQVEMPRLSLDELERIITSRYRQAMMKSDDAAVFLMAFLARGLPYYAHLCGRYAGMMAARRKSRLVTVQDVIDGFGEALSEVDQTITEAYLSGVVSQRGEETLYEPVLLACALADTDKLGQFQQAAVAKPLADLVERTPPYTAATFAFHMNEFCEEKRGSILERDGPARNIRYRFADALMQPYVIITALKEGRLNVDTLKKFIPRRQLGLGLDDA